MIGVGARVGVGVGLGLDSGWERCNKRSRAQALALFFSLSLSQARNLSLAVHLTRCGYTLPSPQPIPSPTPNTLWIPSLGASGGIKNTDWEACKYLPTSRRNRSWPIRALSGLVHPASEMMASGRQPVEECWAGTMLGNTPPHARYQSPPCYVPPPTMLGTTPHHAGYHPPPC